MYVCTCVYNTDDGFSNKEKNLICYQSFTLIPQHRKIKFLL